MQQPTSAVFAATVASIIVVVVIVIIIHHHHHHKCIDFSENVARVFYKLIYATLSAYDELKRAVFGYRRNDCSVLFSRTDEGRAFQTRPAAIGRERRGHQVLSGVLTPWSASTLQQTRDDDVRRRWWSSIESQPGTVAQCRWGNDTSEHTDATVLWPPRWEHQSSCSEQALQQCDRKTSKHWVAVVHLTDNQCTYKCQQGIMWQRTPYTLDISRGAPRNRLWR